MDSKDITHWTWLELVRDQPRFDQLCREHYQEHCLGTQPDLRLDPPIQVDAEHFLSLPAGESLPFPGRPPTWEILQAWGREGFQQRFPDTLTMAASDPGHRAQIEVQRQLGLDLMHCRLHTQEPGRMVALHSDANRGLQQLVAAQGLEHRALVQHVRKHIVYLADWQPGQVFMCGRSAHTNWRRGDVLSFPWHMPHSTANTGYHPRPILFVSGLKF